MDEQNILLSLFPIIPLIGSAVVYLLTSKSEASHKFSGWIATAFSFTSFICALSLFCRLTESKADVVSNVLTWFSVGGLHVDFALRFDKLSAVMSLVITGVGSFIHMYAIGYMDHDKSRPRFFSYLNLFLFSMLLLVLGDNLLLMFVGWEGVGLCSYLLIGFWFKDMENAKAGQKAFVVNRIGDAGFVLGIFTLFAAAGTVSFPELAHVAGSLPTAVVTAAALLLFIGAAGKSAQIPLYVWLPDAMAGPTPVSALIHAATMVTSGIYMITRLHFLFEASPVALTVILTIGTLTALVAATIALVQNDIKKVLAYSTVSQLGYMFMALGAGAYSNGIYHVVTHAFFKACLFMGAGSVIIGCHHVQDMREYGGLRKKMPVTFITYLVATLAIAGLPPLSGFFSKDAVLWTVFSSEGLASQIHFAGLPLSQICWGLGLFTALLTAFYMSRSLFLTFFGDYRGSEHPHESPWTVCVPLVVLAVPSAVFGYFRGEDLLHFLENWTRADMRLGHEVLAQNHTYHLLEYISIGVAAFGILLAYYTCLLRPAIRAKFVSLAPGLHKILSNKWYVDEVYDALVVCPLRKISGVLFGVFDRALIDGSVNAIGKLTLVDAEILRRTQTGRIGTYALWMFVLNGLLIAFYLVL